MTKRFKIALVMMIWLSCGTSNKVQIIAPGITEATITTRSLTSGKILGQQRADLSKKHSFGFAELGLGLEPVRIEITKAVYMDGAGDVFHFEDSEMWSASLTQAVGSSMLNINGFTTLADAWMDWNKIQSADFSKSIHEADQTIAQQIGLQSLQNTEPSFDPKSSNLDEGLKYGLLLKGLDEGAKNVGWSIPDLVHQLSLDVRTNGRIDASISPYQWINDGLYDDQMLKARLAGGIYGFYKREKWNIPEELIESFVNQVSVHHSGLFDVDVQDFEFEKDPPETIVVHDIPSGFVVGLADINVEVMDSLSNPVLLHVDVISDSNERTALPNDLPNPNHFVSTISTASLPVGPATIEVAAQDLFGNQSIWEYEVEF